MPSLEVARLVLGYLSDQGLEQTKSVFYQECPDLKSDELNDLSNQGQKLSLIIEEYFVLKGHDKQSKRDPESILQLLWKQFDGLVGQLKHSTIHAVKDKTKANKLQPIKQGVRVRELNRQNRASLQQRKAHSLFVPNPDLVKAKQESNENVSSHERLVPSYTITKSAIGALGTSHTRSFNKIQSLPPSTICTVKDNFQPVTKSGVLQGNKFAENGQVVVSFNSSFVSSSSPKRKSVQPKRRPVVVDITSKILPSHYSAAPSAVIPPDEVQLDLSSLVEKILGQPEFSEKLAENINRAVEIDTRATQDDVLSTTKFENATTSGAVVDSNKIDNIMEMMKTDPAFEQLFSSFESFNNSLDTEGDCDPNRDGEPSDIANQKPPISPSDNCAMDALLLLANSPGISLTKQDSPGKTHTVFISPSPLSSIVYPTGSPAVLMSPGKTKSPRNRAAQPIYSHVRQLDFASMSAGAVSPGGKGSVEGNSGTTVDMKVVSEPSRASIPEAPSSSGHGRGVQEGKRRGNIVGYKDISQCSQPDSSEKDSQEMEGTSKESNGNNHSSENEENSLSVLQELATHAFILCDGDAGETEYGTKKDCCVVDTVDFKENGEVFEGPGRDIREKEGDINGHMEKHGGDIKGYEGDIKGHGRDIEENEGDINGHGLDTEKHGGDIKGYGGDIKGHGRDIEENEGDINGHGLDTERYVEDSEGHGRDLKGDTVENRVKDNENDNKNNTERNEDHQDSAAVNDSFEKDCGTTVDNEGQGRKDIEIKTEPTYVDESSPLDNIPGDFKEHMDKGSMKEEPGDVLFCTLNQRTPRSSSADSEQVLKRKLKKNKKSSGGSKKRRTLPLDLDVDKFLSRLHYVEEKT